MFFALIIEELSGFFGGEIFGEGLTEFLFELFHHGDSSPRRGEINLEFLFGFGGIGMELDFVATADFLDHFG